MNAFRQIDLTKGKPWKTILLFSVPILFSTVLSNAFSLVNSLVLKVTVGGNSVTSMNAVSPISSILFQFAYGCASGFSIAVSACVGNNDEQGLKKTFYHSLALSVIIAAMVTVIGLCSYRQLLVFLNVNEIFIDGACNYYVIILCSFVPMMLNNLLANFLQAMGRPSVPLVVGIATTALNIALAFLFTGVIKLDTRGPAIATLISTVFSVSTYLIYIFKKIPLLRPARGRLVPDWKLVKELLFLGLPIGFQWSVLFVGSFIQSQKVNSFGNGFAIKATSCYGPFENYITIPFSVLGSALMRFVAANNGAGLNDRIKRGIIDCFILTVIMYAAICVITLCVSHLVPYIFLPSNELQGEEGERIIFYCKGYLNTIAPCIILQGTVMLSRSYLQGIKKSIIPFISGIGELAARAFVCLLLPSWVSPADPLSDTAYKAICFSTPSAWLVSALIMGISMIVIMVIKNKRQRLTQSQ